MDMIHLKIKSFSLCFPQSHNIVISSFLICVSIITCFNLTIFTCHIENFYAKFVNFNFVNINVFFFHKLALLNTNNETAIIKLISSYSLN